MLKKITQNAFLNLLTGIILLITSGAEIWESIGVSPFSIGAHHGIAFFGIVQIVKTIPELMHGCQEIEEAQELRESS